MTCEFIVVEATDASLGEANGTYRYMSFLGRTYTEAGFRGWVAKTFTAAHLGLSIEDLATFAKTGGWLVYRLVGD